MEQIETWKSIAGYEGLYEVSNTGKVKSLERIVISGRFNEKRLQPEIILKQSKTKSGYKTITLCNGGLLQTGRVHRLVAGAFHPNPNNYPIVMHIDNDATNNNASNLKWGTYQNNNSQALHESRRLHKKILQLTEDGKLIKEWWSRMELRRNGFRPSDNFIKKGKPHKGFIWRYADTKQHTS